MKNPPPLIVAVMLGIVLILGGVYMLVTLHAMESDLQRVSTRLDALERMDRKLSETNRLLLLTNGKLQTMIAASGSANRKLGSMQSDLATMSHKISGSFLFRGVK